MQSSKSPALRLALEDCYAPGLSSRANEEGEGGNRRTSEFSYAKKSGRSVRSFKSRENSEIDSQLAKLQMRQRLQTTQAEKTLDNETIELD